MKLLEAIAAVPPATDRVKPELRKPFFAAALTKEVEPNTDPIIIMIRKEFTFYPPKSQLQDSNKESMI